ncbi:MAG: hypothetical protein HQL52_02015 [Magnetococcales bacterium]|nr:hypothetical protein [Magnetococcales bacterium]
MAIMQFDKISRKSAMSCPVCAGHPAHIYRCSDCGEVRCGNAKCTGSKGSTIPWWAGSGAQCRNCGKGHYRMMPFVGEEMDQFIQAYRLQRLTTCQPSRQRAA